MGLWFCYLSGLFIALCVCLVCWLVLVNCLVGVVWFLL